MFSIPQSTSYVCMFKAFLSSDHVSEATGKTIAITISKNGGAFGNPNAGATNATEISSGWYKVTLDTTDTATVGPLAVRGAVATVDDVGVLLNVVAATLTAAQIATGVWQDTTAGDFTTALSVGKSLMNGVSLGTGLTVARCTLTDTLTTYTGNTVQTGDAYARIGLAGVGLTNLGDTRIAHLDADVSTRSTYAGGAVASVTAGVTVTTNNDKTGYSLTAAYDFAKGTVAMTESYAANTVAPTPVQAMLAIHQNLMSFSISGTSYTTKKLDNSTTAFVNTLDSSSAPTATSRT